jgi:hypothetical protein
VKLKVAKAVRVATVAPISAFVVLTILYISRPEIFGNTMHYIFSLVFLVLVPISAYPLQPFVPGFKDQGRKGQRTLAMFTAALGYVLGVIFLMFVPAPDDCLLIYLTHLLSGLLFLLFNKALKIRASGHACGLAGPVVALVYFLGAKALLGFLAFAAACWASLVMKRHTKSELAIGASISVLALFVSLLVVKIV